MAKTIKLWDGWKVIYDGEETICKGPLEVWDMFNWDIENDPKANECALMVTREMFCFGHIDLSPLCPGHKLTIDVIPCSDREDVEVEDGEDD